MKKRSPSGRDANTDTPRMNAARKRFYAMSGRARPWWLGAALDEDGRVAQTRDLEEQTLAKPKSD